MDRKGIGLSGRPAELIGISYSPWTEKARWALDHHKLPYDYHEHLIMLGMPALRCKMKSLTGELTVPAYIEGETRVMDSYTIARHVDQFGERKKLFPAEHAEAIAKMNELSEAALDDGRALMMFRLSQDREAQKAALPPFIPKFARGALVGMVSMAMSYIDREFKVSAVELDQRRARLSQAFAELDRAVKNAKSDCLLGDFTFADIAGASILHLAEPPAHEYLKLPSGIRRAWGDPELKARYPQLLEWRDALYAKYRATT